MAHFPSPAMAQRVLATFFRDGGREGKPYRPNPTLTITPTREAVELSLVGNFVEVWLAKEGHDGVVGINFLEKIQMATPAAALGAMLGGVDYVLMGAGIPREIPRLLRDFAAGRPGSVNVDVHGRGPTPCTVDPVAMLGDDLPATLHKPDFLAIISVHSLATYLYRDEDIRPEGFVVEGPRAGGHSARRAARCSWTKLVNRSTAPGISPMSRRSPQSGCRSGWPGVRDTEPGQGGA